MLSFASGSARFLRALCRGRTLGPLALLLCCTAGFAQPPDTAVPQVQRFQGQRPAQQPLFPVQFLAAAVRRIDENAEIGWDGRSSLSIEANGHKVSLFLTGNEMVVDGQIRAGSGGVVARRNELFVTPDTADLVLAALRENPSSGALPEEVNSSAVRQAQERAERQQEAAASEADAHAEPVPHSRRWARWRPSVRNELPAAGGGDSVMRFPSALTLSRLLMAAGIAIVAVLLVAKGPVRFGRGVLALLAGLGVLVSRIPPLPWIARSLDHAWWRTRSWFRVRSSLKRHGRMQAALAVHLESLHRVADLNEQAARAFLEAHHGGQPDPAELFRAVMTTYREVEADILANPHLTRDDKRAQLRRLRLSIDEIFNAEPAAVSAANET